MNESLRDRLRRLRREEPAPPSAVAPDAIAPRESAPRESAARESAARVAVGRGDSPLADEPAAHASDAAQHALDAPASAAIAPAVDAVRAPAIGGGELHRRLARRSALLAVARESETLDVAVELPRRLDLGPPERLAPSRGGALARVSSFARAHVHGAHALERGLAHDRAQLAASARDPRFADIDLERAVYLDTETTGLSGGAGTYVFLVGLGTFTPAGFEVWQGFLDHPASERALLQETAERIAGASAIVSFFGKSFDRHRLEDKMRIHGVAPPFAMTPHLDLYWPLRRANQGRFENCRLKTLERELAGVTRDDDLPGSFAPAAWFDFLGNRPHRLEGVFRHNLEDVLSLVALLPYAAAAPIART